MKNKCENVYNGIYNVIPAGRPDVSFSDNAFSFCGRISLGLAGDTSFSGRFFETAGDEEFLSILLGLTSLFLRIPFTSGFFAASSKKSLGNESKDIRINKKLFHKHLKFKEKRAFINSSS